MNGISCFGTYVPWSFFAFELFMNARQHEKTPQNVHAKLLVGYNLPCRELKFSFLQSQTHRKPATRRAGQLFGSGRRINRGEIIREEMRCKMEKKKKILIADDDAHVHEMLAVVLSSDEFEIIHAYDGLETVERVFADRPDLVVLDVMMPKKDGRDICRELKANPRTKDIRVLMLSAKDEQFDRTLGLEVGADDYETKPFSPDHLARKIKRMCKKE